MHALLIENRFDIAAFIADELRELGWSSYDIVDVDRDALEVAACRPPDLIIVDAQTLGDSGPALIADICAKRTVPTVFVTADPIGISKELADAVVLAKPFSIQSLDGAVAEAIRRTSNKSQRMEQEPQIMPLIANA